MKRGMDLMISVSLFILLLPTTCIIALLIRIKLGAPILFKQQRPGLHEKLFTLYKFRTMNHKVDEMGVLLPDEDRMTKFGLWLRKYSIDELPQLLNVIRGDMSLVGPRPLLIEYLPLYTSSQNMRHQTKPGITGWAQVNGRNDISWEDKFKLDIWYVNHQTVWLDLKILWITILKVIKKDGITQKGHASVEKFSGTDEVV